MSYLSMNGNLYNFSFMRQPDDNFACRIISIPSYGPHDTYLFVTHREFRNDGFYVDYSMPLSILEAVKKAVGRWAECTDWYIQNGKWPQGK